MLCKLKDSHDPILIVIDGIADRQPSLEQFYYRLGVIQEMYEGQVRCPTGPIARVVKARLV